MLVPTLTFPPWTSRESTRAGAAGQRTRRAQRLLAAASVGAAVLPEALPSPWPSLVEEGSSCAGHLGGVTRTKAEEVHVCDSIFLKWKGEATRGGARLRLQHLGG